MISPQAAMEYANERKCPFCHKQGTKEFKKPEIVCDSQYIEVVCNCGKSWLEYWRLVGIQELDTPEPAPTMYFGEAQASLPFSLMIGVDEIVEAPGA